MAGKPNLIEIPLRLKFERGLFLHSDVMAPKLNTDRISVVCYNENYPKMIEVDCQSLVKYGRIRIGEVMSLLPPGMELDRNKHKNLNHSIIKMTEVEEDKLKDLSLLFDYPKFREEHGIAVTFLEKFRLQSSDRSMINQTTEEEGLTEAELKLMPVSTETLPEKKKRDRKDNRVFSVKEKIKALNLEINPELAQMDTKKKR